MAHRRALACLLAAGVALGSAGCASPAPTPTTSPTPSATRTPAPTPTPSSTPDSTPTSDVPAADSFTCEDVLTPAFVESRDGRGWQTWALPYDGVGFDAFEALPTGSPEGALTCRSGADPDLGTDNVIDLGWAPITSDAAAVARSGLQDAGWVRLDEPDGIVLALPAGQGQAGDSEGYSQAFLFTDDDVRWALYRDELRYLQDPRDT